MSFLTDPGWLSGIIISTLVTIIVAFIVFWMQRNQKEIAYEIISNVPMLSIGEEIQSEVNVTFNHISINDAHLIVLRIWNSGRVPILENDYRGPIRFDLGTFAKILNIGILDTKPNNLKPKISYDSNNIILNPVLLNSQDSIILKVLASTVNTNQFQVKGRIVGISKLPELKQQKTNLRNNRLEPISMATIAGLCLFNAIMLIYSYVVYKDPLIATIFGSSNIYLYNYDKLLGPTDAAVLLTHLADNGFDFFRETIIVDVLTLLLCFILLLRQRLRRS